jgi:uncharacterized protein (DUF58 family)
MSWIHLLPIPEVWMRFILALLGLALAFAAALLSTVSRESGNLWATAILASSALLMATIVGLTTVPYLAKRAAIGSLRDAFDFEVTRAGTVYVIATLLIGIAALNTGNNLLYIVVSAMLAAILVSGVASRLMLDRLMLDLDVPEHVFARRPIAARLRVQNKRRWLPALSVQVLPPAAKRKHWKLEPSVFALPPGRPPERQWFRWPDRSLRRIPESTLPPILKGATYFPLIAAHSTAIADVGLHFTSRGRYEQEALSLATGFPFSLLVKKRTVALQRELVVYPAVEMTDDLFQVLPLIRGEMEAFIRGRGHDLYRIREYMPEDSARHVDWKASAKSGSLKIREFTREDERKLRIVFDNPKPDSVSKTAYERAVEMAASLAWHFASEQTELSFTFPGCRTGLDIYEFLHYLALVQPSQEDSVLSELSAFSDYNLVFTARARGTIPTALWASSYFVFMEDTVST